MGISIITPTGGRPETFKLCTKYIERQDYIGDIQWIVVDDCEESTEIPKFSLSYKTIDVIRRTPHWRLGQKTLGINFLKALHKVKYDKLVVMEDDDWYSFRYLRKMNQLLDSYSMVGEGWARYYNVKYARYFTHDNGQHSGLCQTGYTAEVYPSLIELMEQMTKDPTEVYFDISIWKLNFKKIVLPYSNLCVGIKGMPGRPGGAYGHDSVGEFDKNYATLKAWIGRDWIDYATFRE